MKIQFEGSFQEWEQFIAPLIKPESPRGDPKMIQVPTGTFLMGSSPGEPDARGNEYPQHEVCITRPFAIGRFPVTFDEYDRYCTSAKTRWPEDWGWGRGQRPVIGVSWEDATAYCAWLAEHTSRPYRLPSEAEWEYACRAGTRTRWSFGDDERALRDYAWFDDNSDGRTHPVGEKKSNPWDLHDMHGNVWEWVQDHWHDNYQGAPTDGRAWKSATSEQRVLRGGSRINGAGRLRSAYRHLDDPGNRYLDTGFRLALDL